MVSNRLLQQHDSIWVSSIKQEMEKENPMPVGVMMATFIIVKVAQCYTIESSGWSLDLLIKPARSTGVRWVSAGKQPNNACDTGTSPRTRPRHRACLVASELAKFDWIM